MPEQLPQLNFSEASSGTKFHKDFDLVAVNLLSGGLEASIDLKYITVELSYFEDIFSHAISGSLMVSDALGILENTQMHGNEYLRISFGKESDDSNSTYVDKLFRVYKVSSRQKLDNDATEGYIIYFCSDELLLSEQYKISKSYQGRTIKEIITDVLETYLKVPKDKYNKDNIQDTLGTYSFIIPNFKPFEAIQWLSGYARPADTTLDGSDMLFYENAKDGYKFSSMQSMFKQNPVYTFKFGAKNREMKQFDNVNDYYYNVLSYKFEKSFDVLNGIQTGTFANRLISLDILQHKYTITDFDYNKYNEKSTSLNSKPIVNNLQNRFGHSLYEAPQGLLRLSTSNANHYDNDFIKERPGSVAQDIFVETFLTKRKSQLAINNYTRINIVIPGNPTLSVGQVVNFDIISNTPEDNKNNDKFYSGKYLVSSIRHSVYNSGYTSVIELIRDSNPNEYNKIDNTKPLWKNTVSGDKK